MNQSLWISKTVSTHSRPKCRRCQQPGQRRHHRFKRGRAIFEDLLYQNVRQVGAQSSQDTVLPSGLQVGTGTRVVATERLFTQGNLTKTDNALDIAIQGRGFFEILMPDGTQAYTRDGSFHINDQGLVVTSAGYQLQPPITVPADAMSITVAGDGTVSVQQPGTPAATQIGTVQLNDFINPAGLQARGENLFMESGASGAPSRAIPA